jgi:hypothetical protein
MSRTVRPASTATPVPSRITLVVQTSFETQPLHSVDPKGRKLSWLQGCHYPGSVFPKYCRICCNSCICSASPFRLIRRVHPRSTRRSIIDDQVVQCVGLLQLARSLKTRNSVNNKLLNVGFRNVPTNDNRIWKSPRMMTRDVKEFYPRRLIPDLAELEILI